MNLENLRSVQEAAYFGGMSQSRINNPVLSLASSQVGILLCGNSRGGATVKPLPCGPWLGQPCLRPQD